MAENREQMEGLHIVKENESGVGKPYAPADWPEPGDIWSWRVKEQKTRSGFYTERFLYPPARFQRVSLKSKAAVERYITEKFQADVQAFFSLFTWKIPAAEKGLHTLLGELSAPTDDGNSEAHRSIILKDAGKIMGEVGQLVNDVDTVLKSLKESQRREYEVVEEKLNTQEHVVSDLFERIEKHTLPNERSNTCWLMYLLEKIKQMKQEEENPEKKAEVVLRSLKRSQHDEYNTGKAQINAQKNELLKLHDELAVETEQLKNYTPPAIDDGSFHQLCGNIMGRVGQMTQAAVKLKDMMKIGRGFGKTPKNVLKENFGLALED